MLGNSPIAGGPGWEFYEDRCRHGDFYETLLEEAKAQGSRLDRDGVKRAFLRDVVAKKGNYASVVEEATGRLFPDPWAFVKRVNRGDHRRLIHALNQVESWLVLENICTNFMRLAPRSSFFTVHDSLAVAESKAHLAERAFADTFDRLGIAGNFKSKGFTSP